MSITFNFWKPAKNLLHVSFNSPKHSACNWGSNTHTHSLARTYTQIYQALRLWLCFGSLLCGYVNIFLNVWKQSPILRLIKKKKKKSDLVRGYGWLTPCTWLCLSSQLVVRLWHRCMTMFVFMAVSMVVLRCICWKACTYKHKHTHTQAHTHTHAHTHSSMHAHTHACPHAPSTHIHPHIHTHTNIHSHTHTYLHPNPHSSSNSSAADYTYIIGLQLSPGHSALPNHSHTHPYPNSKHWFMTSFNHCCI